MTGQGALTRLRPRGDVFKQTVKRLNMFKIKVNKMGQG
jgi:hypothetical protein